MSKLIFIMLGIVFGLLIGTLIHWCFPDCPVWLFGNVSGSQKGLGLEFTLAGGLLMGIVMFFISKNRENGK